MRQLMLCILLTALLPSWATAAYQNPTIIANERLSVGSTKLILRFNGNAGEPAVTREYMIGPDTTVTSIRNWVDATIKELDLMQAVSVNASAQPGQTVPRLAPAASVPTARDIWQSKVASYTQKCGNGFTGAIATACTTLKADIESTYQAGYLNAD